MPKILLIEDDSAEDAVLQVAFVNQGFEVIVAKEGEEGIAKAKSMHPDIISLDILLPGINGLEVLDMLKADEATKTVPVIMLSNLDDEKDVELALTKGAVKYMVKNDYTVQQVVETVKQLVPQNVLPNA